jgi:hypothetical protein
VVTTLDNCYQQETRCQIGIGPEETALIEIGNGILSLTDGRYE